MDNKASFLLRNKTVLGVIVALAVVAAGGYLLVRSQMNQQAVQPAISQATPAPQASQPGEEVTPSATAAVREVTVSGTEFKFEPATLTASPGEKIRLIFNNTGRARHDFVVESQNIKTQVIASGTSETIQFTAPQRGTYTFICSVPGHREAGMVGKLVVQ